MNWLKIAAELSQPLGSSGRGTVPQDAPAPSDGSNSILTMSLAS